MNIEEILDMMDDTLDKAWSLPMSGGRCVVDVEQIREMLDEIRINLPGEIKQAKNIVADRNEILRAAKAEAEQLVRRAEDRARVLVSQEVVLKEAQAKANELLSQTQSRTKEMKAAAQEFSDSRLRETEESLTRALADLRETRQKLKTTGRNQL
ncbi:MAG: ATPase [Oscillospiraceae bacterium]|nr:ATPase [Oscillospiraceae bacterium]MBQ9108656.1 ATPase [Oscillospiraceae bacterium]